MDLVFLGTAEFGIPTLEALWKEHRVVRVYTQEPRPAGRGHRERASPIIVRLALEAFRSERRVPLNTAL